MIRFSIPLMCLNKILLKDDSQTPIEHPDVPVFFGEFNGESYNILDATKN